MTHRIEHALEEELVVDRCGRGAQIFRLVANLLANFPTFAPPPHPSESNLVPAQSSPMSAATRIAHLGRERRSGGRRPLPRASGVPSKKARTRKKGMVVICPPPAQLLDFEGGIFGRTARFAVEHALT